MQALGIWNICKNTSLEKVTDRTKTVNLIKCWWCRHSGTNLRKVLLIQTMCPYHIVKTLDLVIQREICWTEFKKTFRFANDVLKIESDLSVSFETSFLPSRRPMTLHSFLSPLYFVCWFQMWVCCHHCWVLGRSSCPQGICRTSCGDQQSFAALSRKKHSNPGDIQNLAPSRWKLEIRTTI